jgi:hypothetical protein
MEIREEAVIAMDANAANAIACERHQQRTTSFNTHANLHLYTSQPSHPIFFSQFNTFSPTSAHDFYHQHCMCTVRSAKKRKLQ